MSHFSNCFIKFRCTYSLQITLKYYPSSSCYFHPPPLLSGQITLFHVTSASSLPCKNSLTSPFSPRANHSLARFPLMGRIFSFGLSAPYLARSSSLPASIFRYWTGAAWSEFYKRRGKYIQDEEKRGWGLDGWKGMQRGKKWSIATSVAVASMGSTRRNAKSAKSYLMQILSCTRAISRRCKINVPDVSFSFPPLSPAAILETWWMAKNLAPGRFTGSFVSNSPSSSGII